MINVFKKRTRLYALTTSALFLLQGVDSSVAQTRSWWTSGWGSVVSLFGGGQESSSTPEALPNPPQALTGSQGGGVVAVDSGGGVPGGVGVGGVPGGVGVGGVPGGVGVGGVPGGVGVGGVPGGVGVGGVPGGVGVGGVPGGVGVGGVPGGVGVGGVPGGVGVGGVSDVNQCDGSFKTLESVVCSDGRLHTIKRSSISVKKLGDSAMHTAAQVTERTEYRAGVQGVSYSVKGTTVELEDVSIRGMRFPEGSNSRVDAYLDEKIGTGVLVTTNSVVKLKRSNIKEFIVGVGALDESRIYMKGGGIYYTRMGATADLGSFIFLDGVNFSAVGIGLRSVGSSGMMMQSGSIDLDQGGIGIIAGNKGIIKLNEVNINFKKGISDRNSFNSTDSSNLVFLSDGGLISFNKGSVKGSDAVALWVSSSIDESLVVPMHDRAFGEGVLSSRFIISDGHDDGVSLYSKDEMLQMNALYDVYHVMDGALKDVVSTMNNIIGNGAFQRYISDNKKKDFFKIQADIKESNIQITGKDSYGIYFKNVAFKGKETLYKEEITRNGNNDQKWQGVFLKKTTLKIPEGIAIYGGDVNGIVVLGEGTVLSGDLFLKAAADSNLSVYAYKSSVMGAAHIDNSADVGLYLSDSGLYLTKSTNHKQLKKNANCIDSCISYVGLLDSSIVFLPPRSEDEDYQTLQVGRGGYSASGDSKLYVNVNFVSGNSNDVKLSSDKLLIYGNVSGRTKVYVNDNSIITTLNEKLNGEGVQHRSVQNQNGQEQNRKKPIPIPIIRVYGEAQRDSFELANGYVTLQGSPYQYILKASGPIRYSRSSEKAANISEMFWDFTLESKLENGEKRPSITHGPRGRLISSGPIFSFDDSTSGLSVSEVNELTVVTNTPSGTSMVSGNSESEGPNRITTSSVNGNPASLGRSDTDESRMDLSGRSVENLTSTSEPTGHNPSVLTGVLEPKEVVDGNIEDVVAYVQRLGENYSSYSEPLNTSNGVNIYRLVNPSTTASNEVEYTIEGAMPVTTGGNDETLSISLLGSSNEGTGNDVGYAIVEGDSSDTITDTGVTTSQIVINSVTSTVSEGGASTDLGGAEISEVASTLSTTTSAVTSTVSEGDASTDLEGDGTSEVVSNSSPSSRGRSSVTLGTSGANSVGRSDTGRGSVISADGISVTPGYHTVSNRLTPIKSVASMSSSASVVSEKSAAPSSDTPLPSSNGAVGRTLVLNGVQKTISSQCGDATQGNGSGRSQTPYLCSDGQTRTVADLTLKASEATQHSMHATNQNTIIKLEGATISSADSSDNKNNVDSTTLQAVSAVLAENNAKVVLDKNSTIQSSVLGLEAQRGGTVEMIGGMVNAHYVGALAGSGSSVNLKGTKINVIGDLATAGLASKAGQITMNSGAITQAKGVAVRSESGGRIELDKVNITVKKATGKSDSTDNFGRAAILLSDNASVDFKNGSVVTDSHALWVRKGDDVIEMGTSRKRRSSEARFAMNHANIEASTVKVEGDGTYGIYFDGGIKKGESQQNRSKNLETQKANVVKRSAISTQQEKTPISMTGTVSLKQTDFEVAKGIAIYGNNSGGVVSLEKKTTLAGDLLLKAENDSHISVLVDNSIVTGGVRVNKDSYAGLYLANNSEWILKRSIQKSSGTPDLGCLDSCVSSVRLVNSAIDFRSSESEEKYQTLHIGNGKGTVYEAQGDAVIHLNARLNPHDPSDQQVTDRLVIHGDVSGKTKIHVRGDAGNGGDAKANAKIAHSVSVIQVYGQARKDSFQLDGNYVALANSPYKYTLRAYGPEATSKQEHVQQKFVKDGGEFWNFRLENQYVKSAGSAVLPEQFVRSVVPQVPTYLVLPNSVFHAGLMDINNQSKQLETLRMTSTGMVEVRENPALYLRGYGGSYRYASDLSALEYGYGGDLDYRGVEAGVLLQTIENADSALSFGVMGTYGKLSLQPLNVEQSQKSAFDKWTATVYGSMQHNVGFYVDGLLSYGLFKGDVLTLARGKTATLKGNPLSASLSAGQTIATGYKGFVFDPQVQVVYQHLQFNKARDIDNFDIEMGNLDQWVARVGGRLTKNPTGSEGVSAVAFYGKLYLAHGFGEKQSVHFNDAFKLGAFGSSLEAGVGLNAKLLPQFSLHADILYQHKLNKAGFSGASFSGGVRYQF
ncbi:autotransporter outer membrane beta-barrel domain-containing protein [Bartonella sp. AU55XJBT]|uniref:autotransporter family protein n=1 Tax=Bartonella sp. AU55XJBT TaxID=3019091 RepID=UPI002362FA13|nr:autotransporter outer membrane beta-barrel domain-containing protein [Bartonella sp. AU55XJBT]